MELYSGHINKLIDELAGLPGIGSKSAQRLAFHLINMPQGRVERLANAILDAKKKCQILYGMLYADRSGSVSCVRQRQQRSRNDHGR